jgi:chorismate lyase/3-hydroxybenzoate synthase
MQPGSEESARSAPVQPSPGGAEHGVERLTVSYGAAPVAAPLVAVVHRGGAEAPAASGLVVRVALAQLGGEPLSELWHAPGPMRSGTAGEVGWAATDELVFAAISAPAGEGPSLDAASRFAYVEVLATTARLGCPHLLRAWNVVPGINRSEDGLERYRRFCRGRAEAFEAHLGPAFEAQLPASSAVGSADGELVVWVLAARAAGVPRENPRQVSAWAYPPIYGPRSPSFARATRCPRGAAGERLLLSGTASIVGHRTVHAGNLLAQLDETVRNLEQLLEGRALSSLKIYVRHAADGPVVRSALERRLGALPALYLQADICRRELLVEVEGVA